MRPGWRRPAALYAVWNPKLWPMKGMSLSMVFRIPMIPIGALAGEQYIGEPCRATHGAVAADHEQDVDPQLEQVVSHHLGVLRAT